MAAAFRIGRESVLEQVSCVLSNDDAKELRWHLRGDVLFMPQGSTFGAQLERAAMTFGSKPCRKCGGRPDRAGKPGRPGTGFVPMNGKAYHLELRVFQKSEAERLGLTVVAASQLEVARLLDINAVTPAQVREFFPELPALACRECPRCRGCGVIVRSTRASARRPITARPTGSSKRPGGGGVELNEGDIARRGKVSRRLAYARARNAQACMALTIYYSPNGSLGRIWVLTSAGHKMLRTNPLSLTPDVLFANEREAQRLSPNDRRRALLEAADEQARALLYEGGRLYNEAR